MTTSIPSAVNPSLLGSLSVSQRKSLSVPFETISAARAHHITDKAPALTGAARIAAVRATNWHDAMPAAPQIAINADLSAAAHAACGAVSAALTANAAAQMTQRAALRVMIRALVSADAGRYQPMLMDASMSALEAAAALSALGIDAAGKLVSMIQAWESKDRSVIASLPFNSNARKAALVRLRQDWRRARKDEGMVKDETPEDGKPSAAGSATADASMPAADTLSAALAVVMDAKDTDLSAALSTLDAAALARLSALVTAAMPAPVPAAPVTDESQPVSKPKRRSRAGAADAK